MNARAELYLRFLRRRMLADFEVWDAQSVTQGTFILTPFLRCGAKNPSISLKSVNEFVFATFLNRASAECREASETLLAEQDDAGAHWLLHPNGGVLHERVCQQGTVRCHRDTVVHLTARLNVWSCNNATRTFL